MAKIILYDKPGTYTFIPKLCPIQLQEYVSPQKSRKILTWLFGCFGVLKRSRKGDAIICVLDIQAVICYWLCLLTFRHRSIFAINLLLKQKTSLKNKIASYLYRKALTSTHFKASVTSVEYGSLLNKHLEIDINHPLIRDVYKEEYDKASSLAICNGSVFCGGRNGRDWDFMLSVARLMPNVKFQLAMPKSIALNISDIPQNTTIYTDIPEQKFLDLIAQASLVTLPLDTDAPAGLIVMFQAASFDKFVITTDTPTTQGYINESNGCLLSNNAEYWCQAINHYLTNSSEADKKAKQFHRFLQEECNEAKYVDAITDVIKNLG